jgi:hypothetical protein
MTSPVCLSRLLVGLRTVIRRRWTTELSNAANQGRVARGLLLDPSSDIARLTSSRTQLSFEEWKFLHRSRLSNLPLLGTPGVAALDNRCRRCREDAETTSHIISHCRVNLPEIGRRHDVILEELANIIRKASHEVRINQVFPGTTLRPDVVVTSSTPQLIIDVTVPFDAPESLQAGYDLKVTQYGYLGHTLPFVVGAFGSWLPSNNAVATSLGIRPGARVGSLPFRAQ